MRQLRPLVLAAFASFALAGCQGAPNESSTESALSTPTTACASNADCAAGDHCGDDKLCHVPNTESPKPGSDKGGGATQDTGGGATQDTGGGATKDTGGGTSSDTGSKADGGA